MVTKIKQIFKQAVLRFWSLRVPLIVVCILLAALLCTAQYQDSSRVASAQMTLNYSEASQGLNPNRTRFTTTDLTSDEVLQSTVSLKIFRDVICDLILVKIPVSSVDQ